MPEPSMGNTPLYYAIESYGYIYGTPKPIELRNDFCSDDVPQAHFKAVIQSLIDRGADVNHAGKYDGQSIPAIAAALQVTDLLPKSN